MKIKGKATLKINGVEIPTKKSKTTIILNRTGSNLLEELIKQEEEIKKRWNVTKYKYEPIEIKMKVLKGPK